MPFTNLNQEKKDIKAEEKAESGASTIPATSIEPAAPVAAPAETSAAAVTSPVTSPAATATTPDATKGRRQSFFNTLGSKKEKKSGAISDGEVTDGEGKKSASSKLGGLFRKPSRAQSGKPAAEPVPALPKEAADTATPISKDAPTTTEMAPTNGETAAESHMPAADKSIGDVGAEAISSGHPRQTPTVEASA